MFLRDNNKEAFGNLFLSLKCEHNNGITIRRQETVMPLCSHLKIKTESLGHQHTAFSFIL